MSRSGIFLVLTTMLLGACGSELKPFSKEKGFEKKSNSHQLVELESDVESKETFGSLMLNVSDSFKILIEGCASGYKTMLTEKNYKGHLYKSDHNCVGKLLELTVAGIKYVPSFDRPFVTYKKGEEATYVDVLDSSNTINVTVRSQIDEVYGAPQRITYAIESIDMGKDVIIKPETIDVTGEVIEEYIPDFYVKKGKLAWIKKANGAGEFIFWLECYSWLTGHGSKATCGSAKLTDISYVLVPDTYGGMLNLDQAKALFNGSEKKVSASDIIAPGGTLSRGGFVTKTADSQRLVGPAKVHLNPEMILVISNKNKSFRYFRVTVDTLD